MDKLKIKAENWLNDFYNDDGTFDIDNAHDRAYEFFNDLSNSESLDILLAFRGIKNENNK